MIAYLDIETTGLSPYYGKITVIGIGLSEGGQVEVAQLIGEQVTQQDLLAALEGVTRLYTYNGSRFDLPFIRECLDVDLTEYCAHHDLMFDCWANGLYGGLKRVEEQLDIPRQIKGINGRDAVRLWYSYELHGDKDALNTLLEYNKEDVANLRLVRKALILLRRQAELTHVL